METSKKTHFKNLGITILLSLVIVFSVTNLVWGWTNPSANPSSGAGAISVSGGNVGIGTASPAYSLDVYGIGQRIFQNNSAASYPLTIQNNMVKAGSGQYSGLLIKSNDGSNSMDASIALFSDPTASNRNLRIGAYDNQSYSWVNTQFPGNVGIGTASPGSFKLAIGNSGQGAQGTVFVSNGANTRTGILISDGSTDSIWILAGNGLNQTIGWDGSKDLTFKSGVNYATGPDSSGTAVVTFKTAGNVGIGVTSPDVNYGLSVGSQTLANYGIKAETTSATNPAMYVANAGGAAAIQVDSGKGVIKALGGLIIENRTSDPTSPAVGQMWIRTDL